MADSPICFVYSVAQCTFTMCLLVKTIFQHCSPSIMISMIVKLPQTDIVVDHALTRQAQVYTQRTNKPYIYTRIVTICDFDKW